MKLFCFNLHVFCMERRIKKKIHTKWERKHGTRPAGGAVRVKVINQQKEKKRVFGDEKQHKLVACCVLLCFFFFYFATKKLHNVASVTVWPPLDGDKPPESTFWPFTNSQTESFNGHVLMEDDFDLFTLSGCHVAWSTAASLRPFSVQQLKQKKCIKDGWCFFFLGPCVCCQEGLVVLFVFLPLIWSWMCHNSCTFLLIS